MCRLKTHGSLCTRSSPFTNWGNTAALGIALIHIWWFQVPGLVCDTDMAWLDAQKRLMGNYQDGGWSGYPVLTIAIKKKHYLWYLRYQYCAKNSSLSRNNIFLSSVREFLRKEKSQSFNGFACSSFQKCFLIHAILKISLLMLLIAARYQANNASD